MPTITIHKTSHRRSEVLSHMKPKETQRIREHLEYAVLYFRQSVAIDPTEWSEHEIDRASTADGLENLLDALKRDAAAGFCFDCGIGWDQPQIDDGEGQCPRCNADLH